MLTELQLARAKAEATYNAAADSFDRPPTAFWARYGRVTVDRLGLQPGMAVLDVGCGTGASALPAAERVGPRGQVIAVDLAEQMLAEGRLKAERLGLKNVDFMRGDMTELGFPDGHFDGVVCVFAVFFVPDMERQVAELWRMVRPGGQLAITSWASGLFEPCASAFWAEVGRRQPNLVRQSNPWDRIGSPQALSQLLEQSGVTGALVEAEAGQQQLLKPEDWWTAVMGSGLRGTVDQLAVREAEDLRRACTAWVRDNGVTALDTNVIYARARKTSA